MHAPTRPTRITMLVLCLMVCAGALVVAGCGRSRKGCETTGPVRYLPERVLRIRLGMTKREVQVLVGQASYSPVDGVYYHATGGGCRLESTGQAAPCGVIADFRKAPDWRVTDQLQSCTWGAIGE